MFQFPYRIAKFCLILVLSVISVSSFAQVKTPKDVITQANAYLKNRQFETAYNLLDSYDPQNKNLDIVLLKEQIALNDYISTLNFQAFSFKDLATNENIETLRGKVNNYKLHTFKIDKVLDSMVPKFPNNFDLYKALGDFYYGVYQKYGDTWYMSEKKLYMLIEDCYHSAIDAGVSDFESNYRVGLIYVQDSNFNASFKYFLNAIALNDSNPDVRYNFAYACLAVNDTTDALDNALLATKLYTDSSEKGDAARMTGVVYGQMGKEKKAIEYMELSNKIAPNNYNTLKILIDMYLKVDNKRKEFIVTENFYDLGPENPAIYNDLADIYSSNEKSDQLIRYFQSKTKEANGKMVQLGTLYFYIGRLYIGSDKDKAIENLTKSAQVFSTVYKPDNPIFSLIYDTMKSLK